jgi:hypothetical protein
LQEAFDATEPLCGLRQDEGKKIKKRGIMPVPWGGKDSWEGLGGVGGWSGTPRAQTYQRTKVGFWQKPMTFLQLAIRKNLACKTDDEKSAIPI